MATFKFDEIGSTIDRGLSLLFYAEPGIGKTTLSSTLPVGETLIINCEGGIGPLLGTGHIVFDLNADNMERLPELYKYIRTDKKHPFKHIVIDNISQLEQWMILYVMKKQNKQFPDLRVYGDTASLMRNTLTLWRDLATENGIVVVFNAWEMRLEIKQDTGVINTMVYPKLGKKLAPDIAGLVDVAGHLEVDKSNRRWIRIGHSEECLTKCQFKGLDDGEEADLPSLIDKIYSYDYEKKKEKSNGD